MATSAFSRAATGAFVRSTLGSRGASPGILGFEKWILTNWDIQTSSSGGTVGEYYVPYPWTDPGARPDYAAQSPAAGITATNAMNWSAINIWYKTLTNYYSYPGFPGDGGLYPMPAWSSWNFFFDGLISPPWSGSWAPFVTPVVPAMTLDQVATAFMSFFLFVPIFNFWAPGPPIVGSFWQNIQVGQRARYRGLFASPQLPTMRVTAQIYGQTNSMGDGSGTWSNGISAGNFAGVPATYPVRLILANLTLVGFLNIPNYAAGWGGTDTTSNWTELVIPGIPTGWDANTNAHAGLLGVATVDFPGISSKAQFTGLTGWAVT